MTDGIGSYRPLKLCKALANRFRPKRPAHLRHNLHTLGVLIARKRPLFCLSRLTLPMVRTFRLGPTLPTVYRMVMTKERKVKETQWEDWQVTVWSRHGATCDRFDPCGFTFTHFEPNWTPNILIGPVCTTI
jgi:hypothetical protein